jgi:hypothetical protein
MENKTCGNCKRYRPLDKSCNIHLSVRDIEKNDKCCRFFDALPKITNGDKFRQMSNADLAELLVYETTDYDGFLWYTSNILGGTQYEIRPDAVEATLKKLNEVADNGE